MAHCARLHTFVLGRIGSTRCHGAVPCRKDLTPARKVRKAGASEASRCRVNLPDRHVPLAVFGICAQSMTWLSRTSRDGVDDLCGYVGVFAVQPVSDAGDLAGRIDGEKTGDRWQLGVAAGRRLASSVAMIRPPVIW
jgi:hypothetical protein